MPEDLYFKIPGEQVDDVMKRMETIGVSTAANYIYNALLLMDIANKRSLENKGDGPRLTLVQTLRPISVAHVQLAQLEQVVLKLKSLNDRPGSSHELVEQLTGTG